MKNKLRNTLLLTTLIVSLAGCGSLETKTSMINPGDTKAQVVRVMGPPGNRQLQGKDEAWQYRKMRYGGFNFVVIWLYDGHVTGITDYTQYGSSLSGATDYKRIRWEDAPNRIIEVRHENEDEH